MKINFLNAENEEIKKNLPVILTKKIIALICLKENLSEYI